tara:strand:- start:850 stop:1179 length:330 start_codon:yes stop_codon:yes gene_type:complete
MRPIKRVFQGANKLEQAYGDHLAIAKRCGEIVDFRYEAVKLRLAHKTFYTPDFFVVKEDHFEFHETKGWMRDDAAVKLKTAATRFHWMKFFLVKKKGQVFVLEEVKPEQ